MNFDNRQFRVNGELEDKQGLQLALQLAFHVAGSPKAAGWTFDKKTGLVLHWFLDKGVSGFPAKLDAQQVLAFVEPWLSSDDAKGCELDDWDQNADHDGSNGPGWLLYCDNWGHVGSYHGAIVGIKRTFVWYGK